MKKFLGDKEVIAAIVAENVTPIGSEMVVVTFIDDTTKLMPKTLFERLQSDAPIDATELRSRWIDPIVNQMIVLLQEGDVRMEDIPYTMETLAQSLDHKSNKSIAKLFNVDFYPQRTLLAIERVNNQLTEKPSETNNESQG